MRIKTSDAAVGKWYGILKCLGIDESFLRDIHGPCPMCGGTDRFRFDDKDGRGTYYCNNCGAGDGMRLALDFTGLPFQECAAKIDSMVGNIEASRAPSVSTKDPAERLRTVAKALLKLDGKNPVSLYLESRGLSGDGKGLKLHPAMKYWEKGEGGKPILVGEYPSMVAIIQAPDGTPVSYHITHLTEQGGKAPVLSVKKILPPVKALDGAAIRLGPAGDTLGICEGIETALAVSEKFGLVCWAACNSKLLEKFEPPECVKNLVVFGDNDKNFEGHRAAYTIASRMAKKGLKVRVEIPEKEGSDFAD